VASVRRTSAALDARAPFDLSLLPTLVALLRTRNVTRAAEQLGLSQPTVSRSLVRLREIFEDELLIRVGTGWGLTERARALEGPARGLLEGAREIVARPEQIGRSLVIAAADYGEVVGFPLLWRALGRFESRPLVEVRYLGGRVEEALAQGEIDLFLGAGAPPIEGVVQRKLLPDRNVLVIPRSLAGKPLDALSFVDVCPRGPGSGLLGRVSSRAWQPRIAVTTPHFVAALQCVRSCELAAVLPARLVEVFGDRELRVSSAPVTIPAFSLCVYSARGAQRDARIARVRDALSQQALAETTAPAS
jgi:DNA-binding transcriptional LysR family regulator